MLKKIQLTIVSVVVLGTTSAAFADPIGVWRTEASDEGGYLHVQIEECDGNLCGKILRAFNKEDVEGTDYEHLGKRMIWNMKPQTSVNWRDGKIWAPDTDKTYSAKMDLVDGGLKVSGCVLLFCRDQLWTLVGR